MTAVFSVTMVLLTFGGVLTIIRILRGPTVQDRLVALDTLIIVVISAIAVDSAVRGDSVNIPLLVIVALVGFVSTVSVVRLTEEDNP